MIEYDTVIADQANIGKCLDDAAKDGWRYVDTMTTYEYTNYGVKRAYVVLVSRGEVER